jgi:hypothetical protein
MRTAKNWNQPYPKKTCSHYGQKDQENIRSIVSYRTQRDQHRMVECTICFFFRRVITLRDRI